MAGHLPHRRRPRSQRFTIDRLDILPALHRCLATTDIVESPHAGVRIQTPDEPGL